MKVINHTPFPAHLFESVDQHGQRFYVAVLRQTLDFPEGVLDYADVQAPLSECDMFFGLPEASSVRQESDLCAGKPKCDVIVNATAYAPHGKPMRGFDVCLSVKRGTTSLIDKTLQVCGARQFQKKSVPIRMLDSAVKWATLTLLRPIPWKLTRAAALTVLPLRAEFAFGGQVRINRGDEAARRVPKAMRLTSSQHVEGSTRSAGWDAVAIAHTVFAANPLGRGYAQAWALRATRSKTVAAPQIERADAPISAAIFWQRQKDPQAESAVQCDATQEVAGMGARSKTDQARLAKLGTVDDAFIQSGAPLPSDFDFGYWNAAPPDQQVDYLRGDETIALTNLCPLAVPGLVDDERGNAVLRLHLLKHECFILVRAESGDMYSPAMDIDTVVIEPDQRTLTLVWRVNLTKDDAFPIRVCEIRMRTHEERDRVQRQVDVLRKLRALVQTPAAVQ